MSSTLLIRFSRGKVTEVTGTITGCGQQANESASGEGKIDGYEIIDNTEELETTERLTSCPNQTHARFPSSTVYYYEENFFALSQPVKEMIPEACSQVLVTRVTHCRRFSWKFIQRVSTPARKEMSRHLPKETRLLSFDFLMRLLDILKSQEDLGFLETFPDKV